MLNNIFKIKINDSSDIRAYQMRALIDRLKELELINFIYMILDTEESPKLNLASMWLLATGLKSNKTLFSIYMSEPRSDTRKHKSIERGTILWLSRMHILDSWGAGKITKLGNNVLKSFLPNYDHYLSRNHILNIGCIIAPLLILVGCIIPTSFLIIYHFLVISGESAPITSQFVISLYMFLGIPFLVFIGVSAIMFCFFGHRVFFPYPKNDASEKHFLLCWLSALNSEDTSINIDSFNVNQFINDLNRGLFTKKVHHIL